MVQGDEWETVGGGLSRTKILGGILIFLGVAVGTFFVVSWLQGGETSFTVSVSPTSGSGSQGGSATATISVDNIKAYSQTVSLTASGQPSGVTVSFGPSSGTPSFTSTMTVDMGATVSIGTYTITITATGVDGKTHSCTYSLTVSSLPNSPPTADFTYSPSSPTTADVIQFTDASTDSDGTITSWSWNFGDGNTDTAQSPTHEYSSAGIYTVTLTVTDDDDATDNYGQNIVVGDYYRVYTEMGIPAGTEIWTWDSYRSWGVGTGEATFDGSYTGVSGIPEGSKCFLTSSNNGNTYAGWGVFLIYPSDHTVNLSGYNTLRFWVKSLKNLKVELQQTDRSGLKSASLYIDSYGWDGTDTWQEIAIPKSAFSGVDFTQIFCPFTITVEQVNITYYIDFVRWE